MGQHGRQRIQDHFRLEQMTDRLLAAYRRGPAGTGNRNSAWCLGVGLGRACASQAVEYLRLSTLTDWLWNEREQGAGQSAGTGLIPAHLVAAYGHSWRTVLVFCPPSHCLLPAYTALLKRNPSVAVVDKKSSQAALTPRENTMSFDLSTPGPLSASDWWPPRIPLNVAQFRGEAARDGKDPHFGRPAADEGRGWECIAKA